MWCRHLFGSETFSSLPHPCSPTSLQNQDLRNLTVRLYRTSVDLLVWTSSPHVHPFILLHPQRPNTTTSHLLQWVVPHIPISLCLGVIYFRSSPYGWIKSLSIWTYESNPQIFASIWIYVTLKKTGFISEHETTYLKISRPITLKGQSRTRNGSVSNIRSPLRIIF